MSFAPLSGSYYHGWICSHSILDFVCLFEVSGDGSIVIGANGKVLIAHNTATGALRWRMVMHSYVQALRIHGSVVVVAIDDSNTVVIDVNTADQIDSLPATGRWVTSLCVFDGLVCQQPRIDDFLNSIFQHRYPSLPSKLRTMCVTQVWCIFFESVCILACFFLFLFLFLSIDVSLLLFLL